MYYMVEPRTAKELSQMRRGAIEFCVLSLLRDEERYGSEIVRTLSGLDGLVTSEGTVYPLLARLRRLEYVETTWRESPHGPPRRYYRLTEAGRGALASFVEQWERFRSSVDTVLQGRTVH
jgi:PadR family transcriptional regulator, regulatory protein PadR